MPLNDFGTPRTTGASHFVRTVALCLALLVFAAPLVAQNTPPFGEDAMTVPGGMLRLRLLPTWTRVTDRWTVRDGQRDLIPFGGELASDSLGIAQLGDRLSLGLSESLMRDLSGDDGVRLTLGRSVAAASLRRLVVPIGIEYGVTSRLTVGVTVPIVQTRTRFSYALNNDSVPLLHRPPYNVGVNPRAAIASGSETFFARNAMVAAAFDKLAVDLEMRISTCRDMPTLDGCSLVLRDETLVQALAERASSVAESIRSLYGVSTDRPGQPFVPLSASIVQERISAALVSMVSTAKTLYGVESNVDVSLLGAARGPAGKGLIDDLYATAQYDSITETTRIGVGDIELGAKLLVFDTHAQTTTRGVRLAVAGLVRLGTGQVSLDSPYGEGTGDGQMDIEGAAFLDASLSRWFALTLGARFTAQTGETEAWFPGVNGEVDVLAPARSLVKLGDMLSLEVTPRFRVSRVFSLDGRYEVSQRGGATFTAAEPPVGSDAIPPPVTIPSTTVHAAGFGVTYSTLDNWSRRGARLPVDVLFTHLQTVASSGGPALKASHTQIQLRVYYRLFGQ